MTNCYKCYSDAAKKRRNQNKLVLIVAFIITTYQLTGPMSQEYDPGNSNQLDTEDEQKIELPKKYKVILHNDDYTPMEFVVEILIDVFKKDELTATNIMLNVHNQGQGVCGIYTYEIAETKVARVMDLAQQHEYPLRASMEAE